MIEGTPERVTLTVTDNGRGAPVAPAPTPRTGGNGLKGLTERLAAAGGSLTAGPAPRTGFRVGAELPVDPQDTALDAELSTAPGRP